MSEINTKGLIAAFGRWLLISLLFLAWALLAGVSFVALFFGSPAHSAAEALWVQIKKLRGLH